MYFVFSISCFFVFLVCWFSYLLEQKLKEPTREKGLGRPPQASFDLAIKNRRVNFCILNTNSQAKGGTVDHGGGYHLFKLIFRRCLKQNVRDV